MATIEKLSSQRNQREEVKWRIENFSTLSTEDDAYYESALFYFENASWSLKIYPNHHGRFNNIGYIVVYLVRKFSGPEISLDFSLILKTMNFEIDREFSDCFTHAGEEVGFQMLKRSDFLERKFQLQLPDVLTVICKMKCGETTADARDKCIQTTSHLNIDLFEEGLAKDFSELLSTGLNHDVEMKCEGESVKVHKIVLCARSAVLKAMLESDMQVRRTGVLEIRDMDARYFQDFVRYLYTDKLPELTFDEATALYETGDTYSIKSLMLRCSKYLEDNLSRENAFQCFALADNHSDQKLKDKILSYILKEKVYLEDEYWSPFCESYPEIALEVYRLLYMNE